MAGSVYTFLGSENPTNRTASVRVSQGEVDFGSSGLFLSSEYLALVGEGLRLVAGPAQSPHQHLTAPVIVHGSVGSPNGVYRYCITFVTAAGETLAGPEVQITLTNQQGSLTNIAVAPDESGVVARKIYRTAAGGSLGTEKLVGVINDNTTTAFIDNVADSALGASLPTSDTSAVVGGIHLGETEFRPLTYHGVWDADESYDAGSVVMWGGTSWVSRMDMNKGNTPQDGSSVWDVFAEQGTPGLPFEPQGDYDPGIAYSRGDVIRYGGLPYSSFIDSNVGNQPDISPTKWMALFGPGVMFDLSATPLDADSTGIVGGQALIFDVTSGKLKPGAPVSVATWKGAWVVGTTYALGWGVSGSDGNLYVSQADGNVGHDPTTDGGVHWLPLLPVTAMLTTLENVAAKRQTIAVLQQTRANWSRAPRPGRGPLGNLSVGGATASQVTIGSDIPGALDALGGTSAVLKLVSTTTTNVFVQPITARRVDVNAGEPVTYSAYLYQPSTNVAARSYEISLNWYDASGTLISSSGSGTPVYAQDWWVRVNLTAIPPVGASKLGAEVFLAHSTVAIGDVFYLDAQMPEPGSALNAYGDGSTASWGWDGTAYDSTSRSPAGSAAGFLRGRDSTNAVTIWKIDSSGKAYFLGLDARSQLLTHLADGVAATDAATKGQLDTRLNKPVSLIYHGGDLWDTTEVTSGQSVMALRDRHEQRERQISQGVFGSLYVPPGRVVFCFSSDDGHHADYDEIWPVIRGLGIPWSMGVILNQIGNATYLTWAQIQEMRDYGGCEVVCHSRNHTGISDTTFVSEGITVADDLAAGPGGGGPQFYVDALIQPGPWAGSNADWQVPADIDPPSMTGLWARSRYSAVSAYITDFHPPGIYVYPLSPTPRRFGFGRSGSIDATSLAAIQDLVAQAQGMGGGLIVFDGHTDAIDGGTGMTEVTNILNWVAAQRDAGVIELMTLTAAMHAKAIPGATGRRNFMGNGDFRLSAIGSITGSTMFGGGWHLTAGTPTIIAAGAQTGTQAPHGTRSMILNTSTDDAYAAIPPGLRSVMVEFDARTKNGAARSSQQAQIQAVPAGAGTGSTLTVATGGSTGPQWATIGTAWTHYRALLGLDPQASGGYNLHFQSTGSGGVEIANVSIVQT